MVGVVLAREHHRRHAHSAGPGRRILEGGRGRIPGSHDGDLVAPLGAIAQHIAAAQRQADQPDLARQGVRQAQRLSDGVAQSLVLLSGPIVRIEQRHIVPEVGDPAGDVAIVRYAGRTRSHDHDAALAGGWRVFFLRDRAMRRRQGQKRRDHGDASPKLRAIGAPPASVSAAPSSCDQALCFRIEQADLSGVDREAAVWPGASLMSGATRARSRSPPRRSSDDGLGAGRLAHLDPASIRRSGSSAGAVASAMHSGRMPSTTSRSNRRAPRRLSLAAAARPSGWPAPMTATSAPPSGDQPRRQRVHRRRAHEPGNEQVGRPVVDRLRIGELLDLALVHDGDAASPCVIASIWSCVT